jgi:hypothetical protein
MESANRFRIFDRHYSIVVIFVCHLAGSVAAFGAITAFIKDIPGVRSFFMTGSQPSPAMEVLINNEGSLIPAVIEAKAETPLRDSPPKPDGFSPLRKGTQIGEAQPDTEWIVIDSVKVKKLTGDDTWVRIANKNDAERFLRNSRANREELKAQIDNQNDSKIRNGWAYLGNNFLADK